MGIKEAHYNLTVSLLCAYNRDGIGSRRARAGGGGRREGVGAARTATTTKVVRWPRVATRARAPARRRPSPNKGQPLHYGTFTQLWLTLPRTRHAYVPSKVIDTCTVQVCFHIRVAEMRLILFVSLCVKTIPTHTHLFAGGRGTLGDVNSA